MPASTELVYTLLDGLQQVGYKPVGRIRLTVSSLLGLPKYDEKTSIGEVVSERTVIKFAHVDNRKELEEILGDRRKVYYADLLTVGKNNEKVRFYYMVGADGNWYIEKLEVRRGNKLPVQIPIDDLDPIKTPKKPMREKTKFGSEGVD